MKTGWEVKSLGEVCEIKPPKKLAKVTLKETDEVSFVPMNNLGELEKLFEVQESRPLGKVYSGYTYFADDDVLVAKITPCFENGKMGVAKGLTNGVGFGSSEFVPLRSKGEIVPEFLFYFLYQNEFRENGARIMTGAVGHRRVPKEYFEDLQIPLPPLEEQKRIVAVLDGAFDALTRARAHVEANLLNARELFETYSQRLLSEKVGKWIELTLSEVCEKITDGTHQTPTYFDEGYIFLSSKNVTKRKIDWENVKHIDAVQHQAMQKRISPRVGDILLAKNGTTGVAAMVDQDVVFDIYVSLAHLRALKFLMPKFLLYFVNSSLAKSQFNKRLKGQGVPNLHLKEIREVLISFPQSKDEQAKIVCKIERHIENTVRLEAHYQQKLTALGELRQSLLQKAFAGELT